MSFKNNFQNTTLSGKVAALANEFIVIKVLLSIVRIFTYTASMVILGGLLMMIFGSVEVGFVIMLSGTFMYQLDMFLEEVHSYKTWW